MIATIVESLTTLLVVVGLAMVQWLAERTAQKKNNAEPQPKNEQADERTPAMARPRDSEEERMRRFMEALGIPADTAAPQRGPNPNPLRPKEPKPAPKRPSQIPPIPPIIDREYRRPTPPPMPKPAPAPSRRELPPTPYAERTLDSAAAPTTPAGRIELPELETTKIEEFRTVSSGITAAPPLISAITAEEAREKRVDVRAIPTVMDLST